MRVRAEKLPGAMVLGRLDADDLSAVYQKADYTVLASTVIENAPTVIGESFAHGVPVIAPALGGIPEFVKGGKNGHLYVPADGDALIEVLRRAELDKQHWPELSRGALETVKEYSLSHHINALVAEYEDVKAG